jgi:hypothetical protein
MLVFVRSRVRFTPQSGSTLHSCEENNIETTAIARSYCSQFNSELEMSMMVLVMLLENQSSQCRRSARLELSNFDSDCGVVPVQDTKLPTTSHPPVVNLHLTLCTCKNTSRAGGRHWQRIGTVLQLITRAGKRLNSISTLSALRYRLTCVVR